MSNRGTRGRTRGRGTRGTRGKPRGRGTRGTRGGPRGRGTRGTRGSDSLIDTGVRAELSVRDSRRFLEVLEELLRGGRSVRFRANGRSMCPTIRHDEVITVVPIGRSAIRTGDVILYRHDRAAIAHRVVEMQRSAGRLVGLVLRGDAADACDEPIAIGQVLGRVVATERNGRLVRIAGWRRALARVTRAGRALRRAIAAILPATVAQPVRLRVKLRRTAVRLRVKLRRTAVRLRVKLRRTAVALAKAVAVAQPVKAA